MNRRAFLGRLAALAGAPLVIEPTLEDIERFAWRRRLFPGWSPPASRNVFITPEMLTRPVLEALPDFEAAAQLIPAPPGLNELGRALTGAETVAAMAAAADMGPRRLQRWFARNVGLPPRHYLRLLRFQKAFEQVQGAASLADHAAAQGFADQAHMARTFREMAGVPATEARRTAKGPFLR